MGNLFDDDGNVKWHNVQAEEDVPEILLVALTKEMVRENLNRTTAMLPHYSRLYELAAGSLHAANHAQQIARQAEKDGEAAIINGNPVTDEYPKGIFAPRAASEAFKEAYMREHLKDTYAARALAESELVSAQYESTLATTRFEVMKARVASLTAILNSYA